MATTVRQHGRQQTKPACAKEVLVLYHLDAMPKNCVTAPIGSVKQCTKIVYNRSQKSYWYN